MKYFRIIGDNSMSEILEMRERIITDFPRIYGDGIYKQHEIFGLTKSDKKVIEATIREYFLDKKEEFWIELNKYAIKKQLDNKQVMIELGKKFSERLLITSIEISQIKVIFRSPDNLKESLHGNKFRQMSTVDKEIELFLIDKDRKKRHLDALRKGWIEPFEF